MNTKTRNTFNSRDTVLVITSFPLHGVHSKYQENFNAVGWHSEKTLISISQTRKVVVLAEKIGKEKDILINKNLLVMRSWRKGNIFSIFRLLPSILMNFSAVKTVFVEFEFNVFGGILPNIEILFLLGLMRLMGKRVVFELHQVITDIKRLVKHINITNPILQTFFNLGLKGYYALVGLVSNSVVVFEEELKTRLSTYIPANKINTLSLAVIPGKRVNKIMARKKLGLDKKTFVYMLFGFINGYKGIDIAIKNYIKTAPKDSILLVAGGMNPYLKDDAKYVKFYNSIVELIKKDKRIIHTGFVKDSDVPTYFAAADELLLPYEVFMSASGPFSLALSYSTPVRLSESLGNYGHSSDFNQARKIAGLTYEDIFFPLTGEHMFVQTKMAELAIFSNVLAQKRSMENVREQYESLFFPRDFYNTIPFPPLLSVK